MGSGFAYSLLLLWLLERSKVKGGRVDEDLYPFQPKAVFG